MSTTMFMYSQPPEAFAKHCLRYGTIVSDKRWETEDGHWRDYIISIDGWNVYITKCNGYTVSASIR